MENTLTLTDLNNAYANIKRITDYLLKRMKVNFIAAELAPDTFKGMKAYREDFGQFLVYSGGDHGLLGEEYNIKFRALHDAMHYEHNLSFKVEDERKLSRLTAKEYAMVGYNVFELTQWEGYCIREVISAEIESQIDYYEKHGKYVEDQTEFIYNYFGIEEAS